MCMADPEKSVASKFAGVKWVCLTLIALLAFAFFDLAPSFRQFLNLAVTLGTAYLAAVMFANGNHGRMILAAGVMLFYNPVYPIDLDDSSWQIVHALCVVILTIICWFHLLSKIIVDLGHERLKKIGKVVLVCALLVLCGLSYLIYTAYQVRAEKQQIEATRVKREAESNARQSKVLRGALITYRKCREEKAGKDLRDVKAQCGTEAKRLHEVDSVVFDLEQQDEQIPAPETLDDLFAKLQRGEGSSTASSYDDVIAKMEKREARSRIDAALGSQQLDD
jgi:hypothetical protein